jgi:hypothetical protein
MSNKSSSSNNKQQHTPNNGPNHTCNIRQTRTHHARTHIDSGIDASGASDIVTYCVVVLSVVVVVADVGKSSPVSTGPTRDGSVENMSPTLCA